MTFRNLMMALATAALAAACIAAGPSSTTSTTRASRPAAASYPATASAPAPLVSTKWLAEQLARGQNELLLIDVRGQSEYNAGHVPGSYFLHYESIRTNVGNVGSTLAPADIIQRTMAQYGPPRPVVLIPGDDLHNATLVALALQMAGREACILDGGLAAWAAEDRPVTSDLPPAVAADVPHGPPLAAAMPLAALKDVRRNVAARDAVIIDVRPADHYSGLATGGARAGHIPGAVNRPFTADRIKADGVMRFKPVAELTEAYARLIPAKDSAVVVHCTTGHGASQSYFVLTRLLGYTNVRVFCGGWSEWSATKDLPVEIDAN
jgi:thiosulfate/3-mercaptopyruvate sulfurtransferase